MVVVMIGALIPATQRRELSELHDRIDLGDGDRAAKRSGYWAMLVLAGVIATAGVIGDSTATVIGAMIVAPLSTPILAVGLGIVTGSAALVGRSLAYVLASVAAVVAIGILVALIMPNPTSVLTNSQVVGRVSPTLTDLVAAVATGFAGSIALTRRDVGDVLPGVAIAISLVPPLGVVGVCLGSREPELALGALVLFASNMVVLIIAAVVVLMAAGYARESSESAGARWRGRAYAALAVVLVAVGVPMTLNTMTSLWADQVQALAAAWVSDIPEAEVSEVTWSGHGLIVEVRSPEDLPDVAVLQDAVDQALPTDPDVTVVHTVGERLSE
ncbi:TIGR00341 family protein [Glycomyces sp. NPDC048151]|uniref:TIGR00341 family protein n=1 Tax=Glycomyces sp. NPDC048151 TaxID=3364002 RepID=UPI0037249348